MKQNFTVRQGALDGVEAFLSVAQHRSFRRAAAELGVTPSAISQAVRTLEARVGAALFIRTTRSVGLTEAGERFISRAKPAFEELVAASEVARDLGQRPSGLLRFIIVGSPAYLARSGRPERPDDLRQHACLRLRRSNGALALWLLNDNGRRRDG